MAKNRSIPFLVALLLFFFTACTNLSSCGGSSTNPIPTLAPTAEPLPTSTATEAAPPIATAETDNSWSRVQGAGKMVVGTAADYPPFEYYTDNFQLDGFDIALIRQISERLGVEVEFRDMAFDGLGDALELDQIDMAVAAISVTTERANFVDFSNVYLASQDAILARADSTIDAILAPEQLVNYRIGIQRESVFDRWLQENLVDTGLMPEENLFLYEQIEQAVNDLSDGLLDLVILDMPPAQVAVEAGDLKLVGQGLNRQLYAIALPKDSATLKRELNDALVQLQNEGRIADLADDYLGLDEEDLLPIPPPEPSPTAQPTTTAPSCIDGMAFVQDLSLNDNNMANPPLVAPGQVFEKGWRVRNIGTCTWDNTYALSYVGGNVPAARMGGTLVPIVGTVPPGAEYDIRATLVAPLVPGVYQGFWTMRKANGLLFGDRIWVGITVPANPTATPRPTQTPAPGISFSADRTSIRAGECVVFTWNVENIREVYFYPQGEPWNQYGVPGQGSRVECPPNTTTYELRVVKRDGSIEIRQITIFVTPVEGAPVISRFSVNPSFQINIGQCVTIQWEVTGNISNVTLRRNEIAIWGEAPVSGVMQDCPPGSGAVAYSVEARGPGGTSRLQQNITIVQPTATPAPNTPTPLPTPLPNTPTAVPNTPTPIPTPVPTLPVATPTPIPPVIDAFAVQPNQIEAGDCVTVNWRVGGDATLIQIKRNDAIVLDNAPFSGREQDCLNESGQVVYRLEVSDSDGRLVAEEATVNVTEGPPLNPLVGTSWRLLSYLDNDTEEVTSVLADTTVTAVFGEAGALNGSAGCNSYSTSYLVDGNMLQIGPIATAQLLCAEPQGIMSQESGFLAHLQSAATYELTADMLLILDGNGRTVLQFQPAIEE